MAGRPATTILRPSHILSILYSEPTYPLYIIFYDLLCQSRFKGEAQEKRADTFFLILKIDSKISFDIKLTKCPVNNFYSPPPGNYRKPPLYFSINIMIFSTVIEIYENVCN